MNKPLPAYAQRLDALHRALRDDFRQLVQRVPLEGNEYVLDAGCGDGFFTGLIATRLPRGEVVALDRSAGYLRQMEERLEPSINDGAVRPALGNVVSLPFGEGEFDVVWSAHCMQSYPSIDSTLIEFRRVLTQGGLLAILETDNLHSLILNWPAEVEFQVRGAEHEHFREGGGVQGAYFPRYARRLLHGAGFRHINQHFQFIHRAAPVDEATKEYVQLYLQNLIDRIGNRIDASILEKVRQLASPNSDSFLPRRAGFYIGSLQVLFTAQSAS